MRYIVFLDSGRIVIEANSVVYSSGHWEFKDDNSVVVARVPDSVVYVEENALKTQQQKSLGEDPVYGAR